MIYSIVPVEELFFEGWENTIAPRRDITIEGVTMQVEMLGDGTARIIRLISPNPYDYTNPAWMPGSIIRYAPKFD
mgnify:CR=1 FL=1|jgi:hypothetical protein